MLAIFLGICKAKDDNIVQVHAGPGRQARSIVIYCRLGMPYTHEMSLLERITIDPDVRFGKPHLRNTRITVGDVLDYLAGGMSEAELLAQFPQLTRDDVRACLAYAAARERRSIIVPAA